VYYIKKNNIVICSCGLFTSVILYLSSLSLVDIVFNKFSLVDIVLSKFSLIDIVLSKFSLVGFVLNKFSLVVQNLGMHDFLDQILI
jgi:hypothetical protein